MRFRSPVRRRRATLLPRSGVTRKNDACRFGLRLRGPAYNPTGSATLRRQGAMTSTPRNSLTYAEAGVDIDAGNAMVERIRPLVRATRRPGADGEIGGFGG